MCDFHDKKNTKPHKKFKRINDASCKIANNVPARNVERVINMGLLGMHRI
jgi:hypothetical protein